MWAPRPDGSIRLIEQGIFQEIGKWVSVYQEALYCVRPTDAVCDGDNFVLRGDNNAYYLFVPGMGVLGPGNVMFKIENMVRVLIRDFPQPVRRIFWIEDGQELKFSQDGSTVDIECTQYEYGRNYVVRVAKIEV